MRPPAIRRTRRKYLLPLSYHFRLHPRDVERLRLWEFWTFVQGCDDLQRDAADVAAPDTERGRRG